MKQVLRRLIVPAFLLALFIFNNPDIACAEDTKNEKTSFISGRISEFTLPESEYEQLRRGMTRASDSLALDFCINGSEPLDFGDGNWYYVLHEGDPLAADPVFSLSSSAEDARLYVCGGIDEPPWSELIYSSFYQNAMRTRREREFSYRSLSSAP